MEMKRRPPPPSATTSETSSERISPLRPSSVLLIPALQWTPDSSSLTRTLRDVVFTAVLFIYFLKSGFKSSPRSVCVRVRAHVRVFGGEDKRLA